MTLKRKKRVNWAKTVHEYARIYNSEEHSSLGCTPFEVYYGRHFNQQRHIPSANSTTRNQEAIGKHIKNLTKLHKKVRERSTLKDKQMVNRFLKRQNPSNYFPGDNVYVRICKGRKKREQCLAKNY